MSTLRNFPDQFAFRHTCRGMPASRPIRLKSSATRILVVCVLMSFNDFHVLDDQSRVAVLQEARQPFSTDLLHPLGELFGAFGIGTVTDGLGLIEHALSSCEHDMDEVLAPNYYLSIGADTGHLRQHFQQ